MTLLHSSSHPPTSTTATIVSRYVEAAVDSIVEGVALRPTGRACATFSAAVSLGNFVGAGLLEEAEAAARLLEAAIATGLPEKEGRREIRRGLALGAKTPRVVPFGLSSGDRFAARSRPVAPSAPPPRPKRPPQSEVEALWNASKPVSSDAEALAWLHSRYRDRVTGVTSLIEHWDLARVLPKDAPLPSWAGTKAGPWTQTRHRLLLRLWDERGWFTSLRARSLNTNATLKCLAPTDHSVVGLVLADPLAVQILAGAALTWWTERTIVVSEGEPDWLAWAARHGDAHADGPAYLGIIAGSWTAQIAARIPAGSRVVVRTHHDEQGDRYAHEIIMSLRDRCTVLRSRAQGGVEG
jgi:hypothetical protein